MKRLFCWPWSCGFVALAKRFGPKMQSMDWEKRLERMPDNAPPKWMFRNITAIRENTDQILELLDRDRPPSTGQVAGDL